MGAPDTHVRCNGDACFVVVQGSYDRAAASSACGDLNSTLAYMENTRDRFLAGSALRLSGAASGWVEAMADTATEDRADFSWSLTDDTAYIGFLSSWGPDEPNSRGTCASLDGPRLYDQDCAAELEAAVCRMETGRIARSGVACRLVAATC